MAISDQDLRDNYWYATVVYLCDYGVAPYTRADPSTGAPWAFALVDLGPITPDTPTPNPQISYWGVTSQPQPTSDVLLASVTMDMVNACILALNPTPDFEVKELRRLVAQLSAQVAELSAQPAPSETKSALRPLTPIPISRQRNLDSPQSDDYELYNIESDLQHVIGTTATEL